MVRAACQVSYFHMNTASEKLEFEIPIEVRDVYNPDIILLTEFKFWDEIYHYEDENENMKKAHGKWLGRAQNHGDYICSCIFT